MAVRGRRQRLGRHHASIGKNGIAFFPTGSPTHDLYGADRAGNNLFGNCLLALDARTGKRLWHFQTVHHDLWDYDLTAAPKLLTVRHDGKPIDIVAQAGKTGFLYVFERLTGKPLWPIEERPVPRSEVPGEVSSPTQPFPTKPPPFARQMFKPEDVNPFMSAEEQERLRQAVRDAANDGMFTPSSHLRYHIQFPGAWGGANWGSTAADPATGMLYVRSLEMPSYRRMSVSTPSPAPPTVQGGAREQEGLRVYTQICAACHGPGQTPMKSPAKLGAENFRALLRQGKEQMPAFSEQRRCRRRASTRSKRICVSLPLADASRPGEDAQLRLPQNPNRYMGPATRYSGSFSAGLVHQQRAPGSRTAVDAARRLRSQRRHHQVARARRACAGPRAEGHHEHRHRAAAKRSGRDGRWSRLRRQLAGPHAARLRQSDADACSGSTSSRPIQRASPRSTKSGPAIHRFRCRRVVGIGH